MGNNLTPYADKPALECTGEEGAGKGFRYGATIMQGWRKSQEDTYKCVPDLTNEFGYFGVFDGHGGSEVAKYLQNNLHLEIKKLLNPNYLPEVALLQGFLRCDASLREPSGLEELNQMVEAENKILEDNIAKNKGVIDRNLKVVCDDGAGCSKDAVGCGSSFSEIKYDPLPSTDNPDDVETMSVDGSEANLSSDDNAGCEMTTLKYLLNDDLENSDPEDEDFDVEDEESSSESGDENAVEEENMDKWEFEDTKPGMHSGSTGTVVLIGKQHYFCANVGDSRCVLCRDGLAIDLSVDHKPDDPDELKRIVATGATVTDGRINKNLNLSRAFGDFHYKNAALDQTEQCISAEPTVKAFVVDDKDTFIVIASDGIWNSMSSQEVVDFFITRMKDEEDLRLITEELFRLIVASDTSGDGTGCDNMTCIVIKLNPPELYHHNSSESQSAKNSHSADSKKLEELDGK